MVLSILLMILVAAVVVGVYYSADSAKYSKNCKMCDYTREEFLNNNDYFGLNQMNRDDLNGALLNLSNKDYEKRINAIREFCGYDKLILKEL